MYVRTVDLLHMCKIDEKEIHLNIYIFKVMLTKCRKNSQQVNVNSFFFRYNLIEF